MDKQNRAHFRGGLVLQIVLQWTRSKNEAIEDVANNRCAGLGKKYKRSSEEGYRNGTTDGDTRSTVEWFGTTVFISDINGYQTYSWRK